MYETITAQVLIAFIFFYRKDLKSIERKYILKIGENIANNNIGIVCDVSDKSIDFAVSGYSFFFKNVDNNKSLIERGNENIYNSRFFENYLKSMLSPKTGEILHNAIKEENFCEN